MIKKHRRVQAKKAGFGCHECSAEKKQDAANLSLGCMLIYGCSVDLVDEPGC